MPVNSLHPEYETYRKSWDRCRDCIAGEDAVKARGTTYLPMMGGMDGAEYEAYKERALFFGASDRTAKALVGACLRREPEIIVPDALKEQLKTIGPSDEPIKQCVRMVLDEVVGIGRTGVMTDVTEEGIPYFAFYNAENILNWKVDRSQGYEVTEWVILREMVEIPGDDEFMPAVEERIRHLYVSEGKFIIDIYRMDEVKNTQTGRNEPVAVLLETITPKGKGGRTLAEVPFMFINANGIQASCTKSPLLDLVNVNISHYRTSADLEHGRHFTALPTAIITGFKDPSKEYKIGSAVAWQAENPDADAKFLEFTGAGLLHLANALKEKEEKMAILGARLLEGEKAGVESAESIRLRHTGEKSALSTIAQSVGQGMSGALKFAAMWLGITDLDGIILRIPEDFGSIGVSPAVLATVLSAVQSGHYSYDAWFDFLKRYDLIHEDRTIEEEKAALEEAPPGLIAGLKVDLQEEMIRQQQVQGNASDDTKRTQADIERQGRSTRQDQ